MKTGLILSWKPFINHLYNIIVYITSLVRYQVLVTPVVSGVMVTDMVLQSVFLTRPSYGQRALAFVTAVLVTVLLVGIILRCHNSYHDNQVSS